MVPVPQIYDLDLDLDDVVHSPCLYMQYIHGSTARERLAQGSYSDHETDTILKSLYGKLADIAVELSNCTFSQIGSLYHQDGSTAYTVGVDYETGKGPFAHAFEYQYVTSRYLEDRLLQQLGPQASIYPSMRLPTVIHRLWEHQNYSESSFPLINEDLGLHNILVDTAWNVVAMIDLDAVHAAPCRALLKPLNFSRMDWYSVESSALSNLRMSQFKANFDFYINKLVTGIFEKGPSPIVLALGDVVSCDTNQLVRGLSAYGLGNVKLNEEWLRECDHLCRIQNGHSVSQVCKGLDGQSSSIVILTDFIKAPSVLVVNGNSDSASLGDTETTSDSDGSTEDWDISSDSEEAVCELPDSHSDHQALERFSLVTKSIGNCPGSGRVSLSRAVSNPNMIHARHAAMTRARQRRWSL